MRRHFDQAQYRHFDQAQYRHFDQAQYKPKYPLNPPQRMALSSLRAAAVAAEVHMAA